MGSGLVNSIASFYLADSRALPANSVLPGNGPVFLSDVFCSETDQSLASCNALHLRGISSCTHGSDVGVHCEGKVLCQVMLFEGKVLHHMMLV